jgi:hypothetical protein
MSGAARAASRPARACGCSALLLLGLLAQALTACADAPADEERERVLQALDLSLVWLAANPPDSARASIGELTLDVWPWSLFSRLHPDREVRARSAGVARARLRTLEPKVEPTLVALSYWSLLLRILESQELDTTPYREALSGADIEAILADGNPTTNLWITEMLRHSGFRSESRVEETYLATTVAGRTGRFEPTVRGAYALYHEIAPAADLGRAPPSVFSDAQLEFARSILPGLFEVSRSARDTDAAAEVLITAAILGERERAFYRDGIEWLLTQQRDDGTYRDARSAAGWLPPQHFRHGVLVVSWALLESLQ